MYLLSYANDFWSFALCGLGFGIAGASFAVGIAFSSIWFPKERQGIALGIFGAAITTLIGPKLLDFLTDGKTNLYGWLDMPRIYAAFLVLMVIIFFLTTKNKKPASSTKSLIGMLQPLKSVSVWRFGLYYFVVFVSFGGWLVPCYTNVYALDLATAGLLASCFSLPSGVIRAFGGWLSDKFGARKDMYWVLGTSLIFNTTLIIPKMDVYAAGKGIMAKKEGTITEVSDTFIAVDGVKYLVERKTGKLAEVENEFHMLPMKESWQEVLVEKGDIVKKKQLIAEGRTHIYFQANLFVDI